MVDCSLSLDVKALPEKNGSASQNDSVLLLEDGAEKDTLRIEPRVKEMQATCVTLGRIELGETVASVDTRGTSRLKARLEELDAALQEQLVRHPHRPLPQRLRLGQEGSKEDSSSLVATCEPATSLPSDRLIEAFRADLNSVSSSLAGIRSELSTQQDSQRDQLELVRFERDSTLRKLEKLERLCHDTASMGIEHAQAVLGLGLRIEVIEKHLALESQSSCAATSTERLQESISALSLGNAFTVAAIEARVKKLEDSVALEVKQALKNLSLKPPYVMGEHHTSIGGANFDTSAADSCISRMRSMQAAMQQTMFEASLIAPIPLKVDASYVRQSSPAVVRCVSPCRSAPHCVQRSQSLPTVIGEVSGSVKTTLVGTSEKSRGALYTPRLLSRPDGVDTALSRHGVASSTSSLVVGLPRSGNRAIPPNVCCSLEVPAGQAMQSESRSFAAQQPIGLARVSPSPANRSQKSHPNARGNSAISPRIHRPSLGQNSYGHPTKQLVSSRSTCRVAHEERIH